MGLNKVTECERTKFESFLDQFQLPNSFKKVGIAIFLLRFVVLTIIKFADN